MSYAHQELKQLPVTEAVHKIKEQVRIHKALKQDAVKLRPSTNPPAGPAAVIHKDIDGKKPMELDVTLDRNVSEIRVQTTPHDLAVNVTVTPKLYMTQNVRKGMAVASLLCLTLVGGFTGQTVGRMSAYLFAHGHGLAGFMATVFAIFILILYAGFVAGGLVVIGMVNEWAEAETRTDLFHNGKLVRLEEDETAEVFKRLSWHIRNLEVYDTVWLNRILDKLWPRIRRLVRKKIERQLVKHKTLAHLKHLSKDYLDISVLKTSIGHYPPKVTGVRVLGDRCRDVILDMEVTFDDDMDFEADVQVTIWKLKPFILSLGLRKFFMRFLLRVVIAPLTSHLPVADSVTIFLMDRPMIDWRFSGVASILNVRLIQSLIENTICSLLLYPKSIEVKLIRDYLAADVDDEEAEAAAQDLDL